MTLLSKASLLITQSPSLSLYDGEEVRKRAAMHSIDCDLLWQQSQLRFAALGYALI